MDKKPTDSEIVKALECCGDEEELHYCVDCPYCDKENDFCQEDLHRDALDLINRLQEKIKFAENKQATIDGFTEIGKLYSEIKAEAYKEFAEDIKATKITHKNFGEIVFVEDIDNLLKELMVIQPPLNDVKCKDCEYLEFKLPYAVCSKAYKGIVAPDDSCGKGKLKELVGDANESKI